jgi:hypothetical protein
MAIELGGSVFEITHDLVGDLFRAKNAGVTQRLRRFDEERRRAIGAELWKLLEAGFIKEVFHPTWLANPVLVKKRMGSGGCV